MITTRGVVKVVGSTYLTTGSLKLVVGATGGLTIEADFRDVRIVRIVRVALRIGDEFVPWCKSQCFQHPDGLTFAHIATAGLLVVVHNVFYLCNSST